MKIKRITCDVAIVGAGASGLSAAISSSRNNASTVLLEKNSFIGGTVVTAMHRFICGIDKKGLVLEILDNLNSVDHKSRIIKMGKVTVLPLKYENFSNSFAGLLKKEKKIRLLRNTEVVGVTKKGIEIISLKAVRGKREVIYISPKAVIDASGEGKIISLSRAAYSSQPLNKRQLCGFSVKIRGVKKSPYMLEIKIPYFLRILVEKNKLPEYFKFTNFIPANSAGEWVYKFNLPYFKGVRFRSYAVKAHNYLRKVIPELKSSRIVKFSPQPIEREGLRMKGMYTLKKKDLLSHKKFADAVARGNWPIEFWHQKRGQRIEYLKPGSFYDIPLRCIKSKDIKNLFATGRCISATPEALASTRATGTCISLGEGAGVVASNYAHSIS